MAPPRFSVVIPTRERPDTLRYSLKSCIEQQDFDDYEIVVCDNHSAPATREVVEAAASPRVKYVRAPRPLAMSANWELGVASTVGEYVLVIGDDDGLLPSTLRRVDRILRQMDAKVLRWTWISYSWPQYFLPAIANRIVMPKSRGLKTDRAADYISRIANGHIFHSVLPLLYNSAVHRSVLDSIRQRAGRIFGAACPDVYSGMAIGHTVGEFAVSETPLAIMGGSRHSTGGNLLYKVESAVSREWWELNEQSDIRWHPLVPRLPVLPALYADAFQNAKDHLFPDDDTLTLDRRALSRNCLEAFAPRDRAAWREAIERIKATLSDVTDLQEEFMGWAAVRPRNAFVDVDRIAKDDTPLIEQDDHIQVDAAELGLSDVAAVAAFCDSKWPEE